MVIVLHYSELKRTAAMDFILNVIFAYKYFAMFGILVLCGVGLPVPEEVTLIGSGLMVGWQNADFVASTIACMCGILLGDSIIFGLGYIYGPRFLNSPIMLFLLPPKRRVRVEHFFEHHNRKALFFARFFAGVRVGIYALAGTMRVSWFRFLSVDFLGALISVPTSIFLGKWAAHIFADNQTQAIHKAASMVRQFGLWLAFFALIIIGWMMWSHHKKKTP